MSHILPIQRKSGTRYQARWLDPAGKERAKTFALKRQAQDHLDEMAADKLTGKYADPRAGRVTVRSYAETWARVQPWELSTRERVNGTLRKHIYPAFGDRAIASIRTTEIQGWVTSLAQTMAASTTRNVFFVLTDMFAAAVVDRVIGIDPCTNVTPPDKAPSDITIPTPAEVAALADAAPDRLRAAVLLGAGAGTRQGEMTGLALDRLVFPTGTPILGVQRAARPTIGIDRQLAWVNGQPPYLKQPKSRAGVRTLPMPRLVAEALVDHVRAGTPVEATLPWGRPDGDRVTVALLFTANGQPISRRVWSTLWAGITTRAKLPEVRYHDLRHFAVSSMIRHGASIKEVQHFAGHASSRTTLDVYGHLWPDSEDRTLAALDEALETVAAQGIADHGLAAQG